MNWPALQVPLFRAVAWGLAPLGDAHVWLMFKRDLRQALQPYQAKVPFAIELADKSHVHKLAALYHADDPERVAAKAEIYRTRLSAGSLCFVARIEGKVVSFNWLRVRGATGAGKVPMALQDDEIYTTNAYTAEAWRGQGLHPALNHAMLKFAQDKGFRIAYTLARADNARSLVTMQRVGWVHSSTLLCFEPSRGQRKLRWLASGSPYPMPVAGLAAQRMPTLAELVEEQRFVAQERVQARPWSHTYRMHRGDATFYLKVVPTEHAARLKAATAVTRAFPQHVPQLVACNDATESWLLTRDHGGESLGDGSPLRQLVKMVQTYASLQARAVSDTHLLRSLPQTNVDDVVPRLLAFLASDAGNQDATPAGAAFFLGAAEARRFFDVLSPRQALLERHLAASKRLPCTLNHGNLRPDNAAITAAGECVLLNWTRATAGPAGLSLHPLLDGGVPPTRLTDDKGSDNEDGGDEDGGSEHGAAAGSLLAHYASTLVRCGYADAQTLRAALPASIAVGHVLDVLYLAEHPMDEPDELQLVRDLLRARLNQVVELSDRLGRLEVDGAKACAETA